ncbi:MAG: cobalamin-binding protein [Gammaproteobacteria bacterium]|nr:cobalamin-binding protein [Gammaproteobacteria bacterium]
MPAGWRSAWLVLLLGCGLAGCDTTSERAAPPAGAPERIIALAPHLTELVYAAGAGHLLVGAVAFSDYPPPAAELPRVGDAFRVDYEAVANLEPDLLLAWASGNPPELISRLRRLGYRVAELQSTGLDSVAVQLEQIGALAGTGDVASTAAMRFRANLQELRDNAAGRRAVRVFYQVAPQPLLTVTNQHVIGEAIALCGGSNIFGELGGLTPVVSVEAVLDAAPEIVLASSAESGDAPQLERWRQWRGLPAAQTDSFFTVPADLVSRPGPRLLDGIGAICAALEQARVAQDQG